MGLGEVQKHQVCVQADFQHAALCRPSLGFGAADRGHQQRGLGGEGGGIARLGLGLKARRPHHPEEVEAPRLGGGAGAKRHIEPGLDQGGRVGRGLSQLFFAEGAVYRRGLPAGEERHVLIGQAAAARGLDGQGEQAVAV